MAAGDSLNISNDLMALGYNFSLKTTPAKTTLQRKKIGVRQGSNVVICLRHSIIYNNQGFQKGIGCQRRK